MFYKKIIIFADCKCLLTVEPKIFESFTIIYVQTSRSDKKSVLSVARLAQQQRIKKREKEKSELSVGEIKDS